MRISPSATWVYAASLLSVLPDDAKRQTSTLNVKRQNQTVLYLLLFVRRTRGRVRDDDVLFQAWAKLIRFDPSLLTRLTSLVGADAKRLLKQVDRVYDKDLARVPEIDCFVPYCRAAEHAYTFGFEAPLLARRPFSHRLVEERRHPDAFRAKARLAFTSGVASGLERQGVAKMLGYDDEGRDCGRDVQNILTLSSVPLVPRLFPSDPLTTVLSGDLIRYLAHMFLRGQR